MKEFVCSICGYVYEEAVGIPEADITSETEWEDMPKDWTCSLCGATKDNFVEKKVAKQPLSKKSDGSEEDAPSIQELSPADLSALFSNLSKACEKQYRPEQSNLFKNLAEYYKSKSNSIDEKQLEVLKKLTQNDLNAGYEQANIKADSMGDRGALRVLAWGEKVTRMLHALLLRYEKEGDVLLENNNLYVCEICGFIYTGQVVPEVCPVCKVPNIKIEEIKRG